MKKFLVSLFILIILGGVVFFLGWVQLSVPPGTYGLMSSKTHGIDPRPVVSGEFRWVWYKIIPTNVKITAYHIQPVHQNISTGGLLPSGNVYALFAGDQVDFSWDLSCSFSYSLNPEELVALVTENSISSPEELTVFQQDLTDRIEAFILGFLGNPDEADELEKFMAGSSQALETKVQEHFPFIENFTCLVKNVRFPDFALYRQVRGLYETFISTQRDYAASLMGKTAENRINSLLYLDELERYGELLTKYPILLEYLSQVQNKAAE